MKAFDGDFVTAIVDIPEEHPVRQGILDGNVVHGESGEDYTLVKVCGVVKTEDLWGSTREFVAKWRLEHGF